MAQNNENALPDITKSITLKAPIQKVWETVSTSEGIAKWFMPNDFQLKEGQEFHLQSPFTAIPLVKFWLFKLQLNFLLNGIQKDGSLPFN